MRAPGAKVNTEAGRHCKLKIPQAVCMTSHNSVSTLWPLALESVIPGRIYKVFYTLAPEKYHIHTPHNVGEILRSFKGVIVKLYAKVGLSEIPPKIAGIMQLVCEYCVKPSTVAFTRFRS